MRYAWALVRWWMRRPHPSDFGWDNRVWHNEYMRWERRKPRRKA